MSKSMEAFRFKQFSVKQDGVAMRVNTDGVLLGAWASVPQATQARILDIGSGSGVIALMLAQRCAPTQASPWQIDALEPHTASAAAAAQNFAESPWHRHCQLFPTSLQDYVQSKQASPPLYDLIVSNPPYFSNALRPPSAARRLVRHTDSLPHPELLQGVTALLKVSGRFAVVLPQTEQEAFCQTARGQGLFLCRETQLYTRWESKPKRVLMEFAKKEEPQPSDSLYIYNANGTYSDPYIQLTKDFYLSFPGPSGD